jgi:hypothetical protein
MYKVADVATQTPFLDMVANTKDYETQGNQYCGNLLHTFFLQRFSILRACSAFGWWFKHGYFTVFPSLL